MSETFDPFAADKSPAQPGLGLPEVEFDPRLHRAQADMARGTHPGHAAEAARYVYVPPSELPEPDPMPGFTPRYIRVSSGSEADTVNVSKRFREGWVPVAATEQPRLAGILGKKAINADGHIEIGGLMLCKLPNEIRDARARYYETKALEQVKAVDNAYFRDQNPRMPKLAPERSTRISNSAN